MNFNTLSAGAKLCKKLQTYATGQMVTSGEVPNIAIINAVELTESKRLLENIAAGVRSKGGTSAVHNVSGFGFFNKVNTMTAKYAESFRTSAATAAEAIIRTNMADGAVIITDCDITAAGLLLGCLRANCPALVVPLGTNTNFNTEILQLNGMVTAGKTSAKAAEDILVNTVLPKGIADNLASGATSFFVAAEVMGFSVPGASVNPLNGGAQLRAAFTTGEQIVTNAKDLLSPKKFATKSTLSNAAAVIAATGGNICGLDCLVKLAAAGDNKVTHGFIAEAAAKTPLLLPSDKQCASYLREVGGVAQILRFLSATPKLLDLEVTTAAGERLKNALSNTEANAELQPVSKTARVVLVKGSACEDGGYVQPSDSAQTSFSGKAWVYASLEDADKAITSGSIPGGAVIVVQNCTAMNISVLAYTIEGMGNADKYALVTDGTCDRTAVLTVTCCRPDSCANEEFANIQTGDALDIDLTRGRFNTSVNAKDQKARAKKNTTRKAQLYF